MNIYIGNLAPDTTEDEVKEAFAPFGDVASVKIIRDGATGESRGFGFVEMPNEEQAKAAITDMNGKEIKGSAIHVEQGRAKAAPTGFGGGRRPGGDRGGRAAAAAADRADVRAAAAVAIAAAAVVVVATVAVAAAAATAAPVVAAVAVVAADLATKSVPQHKAACANFPRFYRWGERVGCI